MQTKNSITMRFGHQSSQMTEVFNTSTFARYPAKVLAFAMENDVAVTKSRAKAPDAPADESVLESLIVEARTLVRECKQSGSMTAAVSAFRAKSELSRELAKVRKDRGTDKLDDLDAILEALPAAIAAMPEAAFAIVAQAVDERRRTRLSVAR